MKKVFLARMMPDGYYQSGPDISLDECETLYSYKWDAYTDKLVFKPPTEHYIVREWEVDGRRHRTVKEADGTCVAMIKHILETLDGQD